MFRQLPAAIICLAFVAQTFKGPFILVDYFTNTAAFAKNCINKATPAMHCNGKCQMMKQLQEEQKKEQQDAANKLEIKIGLAVKLIICDFNPPSIILVKATPREANGIATNLPRNIFHPPKVNLLCLG